MKTYHGTRNAQGCYVAYERPGPGRRTVLLSLRLDLRSYCPTGFDWGCLAAGPAQLALALLADHLGDDNRTLALHQDFKRRVVSAFGDEWTLTSDEIQRVIEELETGREAMQDPATWPRLQREADLRRPRGFAQSML